MRTSLILIAALFAFVNLAQGQKISGYVRDSSGATLPYSSISIKGQNGGTTANAEGRFVLSVTPGRYTIICQHVGFEKQEKSVEVSNENVQLDFIMKEHGTTLTEVIVQKGEDPAYEIIRNAIKKRPDHKNELDQYSVEVYTKGQLRLRDFPKKFMGEKVDFEDGDTSKKKILFLSETVSTFSVDKPDKVKVEVIASKVSGQSDGFGLSAPNQFSFYENNVKMGNINPRGFVSPIADNALNFYRYKYEGSFIEEGREISRIKVTPKRKFEPLLTGYINIVENEWRIHSVSLHATKDYALQLVDTLRMEQLYVPAGNVWVMKSQVIYPAIKMFGFDAHGSFANVYSNYNLNPQFEDGFFTRTVIKYTDSSNKRPSDYWEENRPIVLQEDEVRDYQKKDSLEAVHRSPAYRDSIDKEGNKVKPMELLLTGFSFSNTKKHSSISFAPLIQVLSYNTVEGTVADARVSYFKRLDTTALGTRSYTLTMGARYGFINEHFNPRLGISYRSGGGSADFSSIHVEGGRHVFQFNNENPVDVFQNTISTLFYGNNQLKIYEAGFATVRYSKGMERGVYITAQADYQNRSPLENTTTYTVSKSETKLTPNRPIPLTEENIPNHQAVSLTFALRWQPGVRYIEFPGQKINIGSRHPVFTGVITKGLKNVFESDVDYTKWLFRVTDQVNLKMFGSFNYRIDAGGFLDRAAVGIPDYIHFKGNASDVAGSFGDRFQLVPHYYFSTTTRLYGLIFSEHHFNGFITNKIPGLKHLKWNLVGGARALTTRSGRDYIEPFIGLENIFKVLRVDYVWGFERGGPTRGAVRFGLSGGIFGN